MANPTRQALHAKRLAAGLCVLCGLRPHEPTSKLCSVHTAKRRAWMQAKYASNRQKRVCVKCPRRAQHGSVMCADHGKRAKQQRQARLKKIRAEGRCAGCPEQAVRSGWCAKCGGARSKSALRRDSNHRQRRERAGQCIQCGEDWISDKFTRCPECRRINALKAKERAAELIRAGLCRRCGRGKPCDGSTACKKCRAVRRARSKDV